MKLAVLFLGLSTMVAIGEVERSLGKSPNGRHELVLRAESEQDYGWVLVKDLVSGSETETNTAQGYRYFPTDDVEAYWKPSSDAFAVKVRGTKTTLHTDLYFLDGQHWEKAEFPGFVENILGRQGVTRTGRNVYIEFNEFLDGTQFTLVCHVEPDWQQKHAADKIKEWTPANATDWIVKLEYQPRTSPNCWLISIDPYREADNEPDQQPNPKTKSP